MVERRELVGKIVKVPKDIVKSGGGYVSIEVYDDFPCGSEIAVEGKDTHLTNEIADCLIKGGKPIDVGKKGEIVEMHIWNEVKEGDLVYVIKVLKAEGYHNYFYGGHKKPHKNTLQGKHIEIDESPGLEDFLDEIRSKIKH